MAISARSLPGATWRTPLTREALTRALDADARTACATAR